MKHHWRFCCLGLIVFVITACEALGVPLQSTAPSVNQPIADTPYSVPDQLPFPQMTETALAWPTVIYPTEKPLTPEEFFPLSQLKTTSPDGNYAITCDYSFPTLFYAPTITVIATTDRNFGCGSERSYWSPDSSYVFLVEGITEDIYRWRMDGSPPEFLEINKVLEPKKLHYPDWSVKMRWSPDGKYLAIHKFDLYVVTPDDEESFRNPLLIEECSGCFEEFRWITPRLLLVVYFKAVSIVHVPSGNALAGISTSGGSALNKSRLCLLMAAGWSLMHRGAEGVTEARTSLLSLILKMDRGRYFPNRLPTGLILWAGVRMVPNFIWSAVLLKLTRYPIRVPHLGCSP